MLEILVCGGREFNEEGFLYRVLDSALAHYKDIKIIAGGARGADSLAVDWAKSRNVPFQEFPANWTRYKKSAGPRRNQQMLDENNIFLVIAFPGGSGTADMVARAEKAGIHVARF